MSDLPPPNPPEMPPPTPPEVPPAASTPEPPSTPPVDVISSSGDPLPKDGNEKTLGLVMHLLPLAGLVLFWTHIPLLNIIAPLVLWLMKKDQSAYLDAVGKEVLNFQIVVGIAVIVLALSCIGIPLLVVLAVVAIYYIAMAAVAANEGKFYRFPYTLRLIK